MKRNFVLDLMIVLLLVFTACDGNARRTGGARARADTGSSHAETSGKIPRQGSAKIIHVIVALCDNKNQGIVPVPASLGNGDDPANNLYWGAAYGVKSFFREARDWKLVSSTQNPKAPVLERSIFKHQNEAVFLVADAYRGKEIRQSIIDFLYFASGRNPETVSMNLESRPLIIYSGGAADLIAYAGHDGLMDFTLDEHPTRADDRHRDAIILACASKLFFEAPLRRTGAHPLLWTTGLMAPEAYALKAAIDGWLSNESGEEIRSRAARSYDTYQKCGMKAAMHLFSSGW